MVARAAAADSEIITWHSAARPIAFGKPLLRYDPIVSSHRPVVGTLGLLNLALNEPGCVPAWKKDPLSGVIGA